MAAVFAFHMGKAVAHAIEFYFGKKCAEARGQALFYLSQSGKRAGIVLILDSDVDWKYFIRVILERITGPGTNRMSAKSMKNPPIQKLVVDYSHPSD